MPALRTLGFRRLASTLLLVLGLAAAGSGLADNERRYEGLLLPDDFGGPVSVSLELRKLQGLLVGEFKAESPYSGNGRVSSGDMNGSKCDFHVQTGAGPILHLTGSCTETTFEGKYRQAERNDAGSRGRFRLASKPAEDADDTQAAAARKAAVGDRVIICAYGMFDESEVSSHKPRLVYLDAQNNIARTGKDIPVQLT